MNGGEPPALQLPDERAGPKLTTAQRTTLIAVISTYWNTATVQDVLHDEYEGFPAISDRIIRYYRARIESGALKVAEATRNQALAAGLALKSTRVAHLARMHDQLARVPIAEYGERWQLRLDVARERRELLNQIAREMGLEAPKVPPLSGGLPAGEGLDLNGSGVEADAARMEAAGLLADLQRRREASAAALAAAEHAAHQARQRAAAD